MYETISLSPIITQSGYVGMKSYNYNLQSIQTLIKTYYLYKTCFVLNSIIPIPVL